MFSLITMRIARTFAFPAITVSLIVAMLATATLSGVAAGQPAERGGKGQTPISLSVEPVQPEILRCTSERLDLVIANTSSEAVYTDVFIKVDAPLEASRSVISSYVAAKHELVVPVDVTAPDDTSQGEYDLSLEVGGSRERLTVPITVLAPEDRQCLPKDGMTATATSSHVGYEASRAIDDEPTSMWHSEWTPYVPLPQAITIDLGNTYDVTEIRYQPRIDGNLNGTITQYNIYASADGQQFALVASGEWAANSSQKILALDASGVRYVRLEAVQGHNGFASAAEISFMGQEVKP